ncbi:alpha/beta hydrolase [Staphylococcus chromogenes]|nr:alpha/beta hydrolase [Staphylococcus chromogenes]
MSHTAKLNPLHFESADFAPKYYDSHTDGPVLVLLHGTFGSTAGNFGLIYQALSSDFRVIGLDFQEPDAKTLEIEDLVAQTLALVDGLGLAQAHVLGYSQGAVAAAAFAGSHPQRVDKLVLLAGWLRPDAYLGLRHDVWHALRAMGDDAGLRKFNTMSALSPEFVAGLSPAQLRATLNSIRFTSFGDKQMELNRRVDISALVPRIQAPTLVLSCDNDMMIPPHLQQDLAASIAGAQLKRLRGGHGIVFEDPDAVSAAVREFLLS